MGVFKFGVLSSVRFALLCLALGAPSLYAKKKVTIACIDCISSASLYPKVAEEKFPDHEIEWIFVHTKRFEDKNKAKSK